MILKLHFTQRERSDSALGLKQVVAASASIVSAVLLKYSMRPWREVIEKMKNKKRRLCRVKSEIVRHGRLRKAENQCNLLGFFKSKSKEEKWTLFQIYVIMLCDRNRSCCNNKLTQQLITAGWVSEGTRRVDIQLYTLQLLHKLCQLPKIWWIRVA